MPADRLVVFDIETVPDPERHVGDGFPKLPHHQIVAIGFVDAAIEHAEGNERYALQEVRCGGDASFEERQLLEGFFVHFGQSRPRLVSWNGRGFDLPVIRYRAMLHGLSAPWLYRTPNRFEAYGYRYSEDRHCDLMDVLSDFGAARNLKLDDMAHICGLPGKLGVDGSQVKGLHEAGEIKKIRNYCETDVLNTYLVYLRWRLHAGWLTRNDHDAEVDRVRELLGQWGEDRPHIHEYHEAWAQPDG